MKKPVNNVYGAMPPEGIFRENFEQHILPGLIASGHEADSGFTVGCALMYFLGTYQVMLRMVEGEHDDQDFLREFEIQRDHQLQLQDDVLGKPN